MNLSDIAISNIKGSDYCCIISGISKTEAINLMQLKLKKKFLLPWKSYFLKRGRYWESISIYKISSGEINYKYFVDYLYNDHKAKPNII